MNNELPTWAKWNRKIDKLTNIIIDRVKDYAECNLKIMNIVLW